MLSGERRSTSAAHHFSFCSKLPYLASSAAYVNPCRPAALALISEGRGATNDRRRSAGNQLGSSGRAGRYWPVKRVIRSEPPEDGCTQRDFSFLWSQRWRDRGIRTGSLSTAMMWSLHTR